MISWDEVCQAVTDCGGKALIGDLPLAFQQLIQNQRILPYLNTIGKYSILPIWIDHEGYIRLESDWQKRLLVGRGTRSDLVYYLQQTYHHVQSLHLCAYELGQPRCQINSCHYHHSSMADIPQCYKDLLANALELIKL